MEPSERDAAASTGQAASPEAAAWRFRSADLGASAASLSSLRAFRFTATRRRETGADDGDVSGEDGEEEDDDEDEEEEEEEEDDDHVHRSWTTEKETDEALTRSAAAFRFRDTHDIGGAEGETEDKAEHGAEDEEEEEEEDDGSDESFGSMEWVTMQLRRLERTKQQLGVDAAAKYEREEQVDAVVRAHVEDDVEKSVREALTLLNDHTDDTGGEHEGVEEEEEDGGARWRLGETEDGKPYYFDIVQEAMASEWKYRRNQREGGGGASRGGADSARESVESRHQVAEEEEHDVEEEEEEDEETTRRDVQQEQREDDADEWLEAYTAKGRVYYYNRKTRESSWTKPASLERKNPTQAQEGYTETTEHEDNAAEKAHGDEEEEEDRAASSREAQRAHSSTSSTSSVDEHVSQSSQPTSDSLFCCFCGSRVAGAGGFRAHFATCATLHAHKRTASPLYEQFQQMLTLLSEDTTLRSMHYAAAYPDATPLVPEDEPLTRQAIRESLVLLHPPRSAIIKPRSPGSERVPLFLPATKASSSAKKHPSTVNTAAAREPAATARYASMKQRPAGMVLLNMETCRHCKRSFAEGRLAKHEAVCPRVFGNEGSWGRGSVSVHKSSVVDPQHQHQQQHQQRQDMLRALQRRTRHAIKAKQKHNLALSFQEHQASLVECPCCRRKFAPSGAQQHIDICKSVQHRPRNPIPLMKDFAIAG